MFTIKQDFLFTYLRTYIFDSVDGWLIVLLPDEDNDTFDVPCKKTTRIYVNMEENPLNRLLQYSLLSHLTSTCWKKNKKPFNLDLN